jgi:hypothetical protein
MFNDYWRLLASAGEGFNWRGAWSSMPFEGSYAAGDVVSYNSKIYVAKTPFMMSYEPGSGTPGEMGAGWELMLYAFNWRGAWIQDENPVYALNDVVEYNGSSYIATGGDSWQPPVSEGGSVNSGWSLLAAKGETGEGFNYMGPWQEGVQYTKNDIVSYEGSTYILPGDEYYGAIPTDTNSWNLFTSKGEDSAAATEESFPVVFGTLGGGTQPTFNGAPLATGSYVKAGQKVHFRISINFDNVTSFGTGQYYLDLPFPAKYSYEFTGGILRDSFVGRDYPITGNIEFAGNSRMYLRTLKADEQFSYTAPFTSASPVGLATDSHRFYISGDYITE